MINQTATIFAELNKGAREYIFRRNQKLLTLSSKGQRYFTKSESIEYLQTSPTTLDKYIAQSDINPKRHEHSLWAITLDEMYYLRNEIMPNSLRVAPKFVRSEKQKCQVIVIQNQKGGVGKTVSSVTYASGLAVAFHQEYRVGIIDLDGQCTASMYYAPEADLDGCITAGDLISGNYELDNNETLKDAISSAFLPTTIPNLRVLPAAQRDRSIESWFHKSLTSGLPQPYHCLKNIIDEIEDEFDILIVDTPPSMAFITLNAYYAATSVIFPLGASENDLDATCGYFEYISGVWDLMENNGHKGYDFVRLLLTNYKEETNSTETRSKVADHFGNYLYATEFQYSVAIRECSSLMSTVFDMSKSEYPKTKSTFNRATVNSFSVVSRLHADIINVWRGE